MGPFVVFPFGCDSEVWLTGLYSCCEPAASMASGLFYDAGAKGFFGWGFALGDEQGYVDLAMVRNGFGRFPSLRPLLSVPWQV
jgi:hypothetical protein